MDHEEIAAAFRRDGYVSPLRVVSPTEADGYRARFDALEARVGREKAAIGLVDYHYEEAFIRELATHPTILDAVEAILGPNILLLATHFFCKYGQTEKFVAWHQDATYWGLEPPIALTAWFAIDDSDVENGCMRVLPGTHQSGIREHGTADATGNLLSINQEVPVTPAEAATAADLILRAGEMSLHDGALIHGSLPNRSHRRRCGLTLRYIPTTVRQTASSSTGRPWHPLLVRGEDQERHWAESRNVI